MQSIHDLITVSRRGQRGQKLSNQAPSPTYSSPSSLSVMCCPSAHQPQPFSHTRELFGVRRDNAAKESSATRAPQQDQGSTERTVGLEEGEVSGVREFRDPRRLHLPPPTPPPGQVSHQLCACWLAQMSRGIEPRQEAKRHANKWWDVVVRGREVCLVWLPPWPVASASRRPTRTNRGP